MMISGACYNKIFYYTQCIKNIIYYHIKTISFKHIIKQGLLRIAKYNCMFLLIAFYFESIVLPCINQT